MKSNQKARFVLFALIAWSAVAPSESRAGNVCLIQLDAAIAAQSDCDTSLEGSYAQVVNCGKAQRTAQVWRDCEAAFDEIMSLM